MVASVSRIAQVMGLRTIAEFVENDEIAEKLRSMRVDYGQGYGIERPKPLSELLDEWVNGKLASIV